MTNLKNNKAFNRAVEIIKEDVYRMNISLLNDKRYKNSTRNHPDYKKMAIKYRNDIEAQLNIISEIFDIDECALMEMVGYVGNEI